MRLDFQHDINRRDVGQRMRLCRRVLWETEKLRIVSTRKLLYSKQLGADAMRLKFQHGVYWRKIRK
jgi:hypothetical protein